MNTSKQSDWGVRPAPQENLESPFLSETLFAGETTDEWDARLGALEAESPFLNSLGKSRTIIVEHLEVEGSSDGGQWVDAVSSAMREVEDYDDETLADLEYDLVQLNKKDSCSEKYTTEEAPLTRMKFEFQTKNRIWRNDGQTASKLKRKYGPDDFLVNQEDGVRLETDNDYNGFAEFETEWFRAWPKLKKAVEKAVEMTEGVNKAGPSKFDNTRKAFPFNIKHLRKGTAKEIAQGYWDPRKGKENDKQKILRTNEELEVELIDTKWVAKIQSSESFFLEYYESFLRQHEDPILKDYTLQHAKIILGAANVNNLPHVKLVKLHSFLQIIINYITRGRSIDVRKKPAKFAFWLMSRTNFASMYQSLLSDKEKKLFRTIVEKQIILKKLGLNVNSPFFYMGYGEKNSQPPSPPIHKWLTGILNGKDYLSERDGEEMSGAMGHYDVETKQYKKNKQGRRVKTKDRWLVKFETRGTIMGGECEAKDWVKYTCDLYDRASRREIDAIRLAYQRGIVDEIDLTDFVFNAHHPELKGRRIRKNERNLAEEWLRIRTDLIRQALPGIQHEMEKPEDLDQGFEALSDEGADLSIQEEWDYTEFEDENFSDDDLVDASTFGPQAFVK